MPCSGMLSLGGGGVEGALISLCKRTVACFSAFSAVIIVGFFHLYTQGHRFVTAITDLSQFWGLFRMEGRCMRLVENPPLAVEHESHEFMACAVVQVRMAHCSHLWLLLLRISCCHPFLSYACIHSHQSVSTHIALEFAHTMSVLP